jgi:hypothetical protein
MSNAEIEEISMMTCENVLLMKYRIMGRPMCRECEMALQ